MGLIGHWASLNRFFDILKEEKVHNRQLRVARKKITGRAAARAKKAGAEEERGGLFLTNG